jgi:hypothetical protein
MIALAAGSEMPVLIIISISGILCGNSQRQNGKLLPTKRLLLILIANSIVTTPQSTRGVIGPALVGWWTGGFKRLLSKGYGRLPAFISPVLGDFRF